jgi:hypothetical protein
MTFAMLFNPDPVTVGFAIFGMFVLCRLIWKKA